MDTRSWTDEHSRAIAAVAPSVPEAAPDELDRTWAKVRKEMADTPSRRRARIVVGAVIAAAALGVGGVAAADIYTARSGKGPVDAEDERLGGPGEKLDPTAPDYGTVIDEETTDIPFPSDEARQISRADLVADGRRDEPGSASVSTGAMRFWTARAAQCAWANEWVVAWEAGDDAASAEAAAMLVASPDWPAVTDVDPKQTMDYIWQDVQDAETGKIERVRTRNETPAGYFPLVRAAVQDQNVDELGEVLASEGACNPSLVPDFPQVVADLETPRRD